MSGVSCLRNARGLRSVAVLCIGQAMADAREKKYEAEVVRWLASEDGHLICDLAGTTPTEVLRRVR